MSRAVICDECGRIVNSSHALHCRDAVTSEFGLIYGADICKDCLHLFDKKADIYGWHLFYNKEVKGDKE